jgi:hypothetical protein
MLESEPSKGYSKNIAVLLEEACVFSIAKENYKTKTKRLPVPFPDVQDLSDAACDVGRRILQDGCHVAGGVGEVSGGRRGRRRGGEEGGEGRQEGG